MPKNTPGRNPAIPQWMIDEVARYDLELNPPPQTILDIGANIGAYTLRCIAKWPEAWILAYEPVRRTWVELEDNTEEHPTVETFNEAVRFVSGHEEIYLGDISVTSSFHQRGRQTNLRESVVCTAADTIESAELVKIDTEGCEVEILSILNLSDTRAVAVEYHSMGDRDKILTMLEARSFKLLHEWVGEPGYGVFRFGKDAGVALPAMAPKEVSGEAPERGARALPGNGEKKARKLYFAVAGHYANNDLAFVQSLLQLAARPTVALNFGWSCDPSVERARNILTANFLETDCTHILFVDTDIGFTPEDVARICSHDEPVVGGIYALKTPTSSVQWCANGLQPGDAPIREDGLSEVKYAGTGFLCVAREVFEKLKKHCFVFEYAQDFSPYRRETAFWFQRVCCDRFLTEDWNFSHICQDMGIKIFLDSKVVLQHAGRAVWPLPIQTGNPFVSGTGGMPVGSKKETNGQDARATK